MPTDKENAAETKVHIVANLPSLFSIVYIAGQYTRSPFSLKRVIKKLTGQSIAA